LLLLRMLRMLDLRFATQQQNLGFDNVLKTKILRLGCNASDADLVLL
jgi:hypothetical protein